MGKEAFDENKEGVRYIYSFGDAYSKYEIYYDMETWKWYKHEYHYGSLDGDEYDYGIHEVDKRYVIRNMVDENELRKLLRYYKELDAEILLPNILGDLCVRNGAYPHITGTGFLETLHYIYYRFQNGDYAIYSLHGFYSTSCHENLDYSVVSRIIKEKDTVVFYQYSYPDKSWESFPLLGERR